MEGNVRTLKLIRPSRIRQNLKPLIQNTRKKLAQTLYYKNQQPHQSPLTRGAKAPVHQRLGANKRLVPLGTNTSTILPKRNILKYPNRGGNPKGNHRFRQQKLQRLYSAQSRIERIRADQRNGGVIKLRRLNRVAPSVKNLLVEVNNPNYVPEMAIRNGVNAFFSNQFSNFKFKMVLNPQIKGEIEEIQRDSIAAATPFPPETRIDLIHTTSFGMSQRFGML